MSKDIKRSRDLKTVRIRSEIEIILQSPLKEEEWQDLVEENYIEELLNDDLSCKDVADKVQRRRKVYGQRGARKDKATRILSEQEAQQPSGYVRALSILVAQDAAKDPEVKAFRSDVFGGKLLSFEAVEGWLLEQFNADGLPTWWLEYIPISGTLMNEGFVKTSPQEQTEYGTFKPDVFVKIFSDEQPIDQVALQIHLPLSIPMRLLMDFFHFRLLSYGTPGSNDTKEIPTARNGILERLRLLSRQLAQEYSWSEAEATIFILTGSIPEIIQVDSTAIARKQSALSRIVLTVDPSLSPKEVAEHYRKICQDVIGTRHRDLSEKHMQLAIFAAKQPEDRTWLEKMTEWNRAHPVEWNYVEVSNFSHDCLQARRRLLRSE